MLFTMVKWNATLTGEYSYQVTGPPEALSGSKMSGLKVRNFKRPYGEHVFLPKHLTSFGNSPFGGARLTCKRHMVSAERVCSKPEPSGGDPTVWTGRPNGLFL